jgi:hypothetical protein
MTHAVFCGFSLPVAMAFLALVLILILMAPTLARELAVQRRPPPIRMPARTPGAAPVNEAVLDEARVPHQQVRAC